MNSQLQVKVQFREGGTDMFSELLVYISQFWLYNSQLCVMKSELQDINLQRWEKQK